VFHALSNPDAKKRSPWCNTLLSGQLLYQFESKSISVISPSSDREQVEGKAIVYRFPYSDCLLTMEEVICELGLSSTMPLESPWCIYLFYGKVWSPKMKFQVDSKVLQDAPLSKKTAEMTTMTLSKWSASPTSKDLLMKQILMLFLFMINPQPFFKA
jgi:hypothetical protein